MGLDRGVSTIVGITDRGEALPTPSPSTDFVRRSYRSIGEPLNLLTSGREWFSEILRRECRFAGSANGLVLGATPWLGVLTREMAARTAVVDVNAAMLRVCRAYVRANSGRAHGHDVTFYCAQWQSMPSPIRDVEVVVGDNALSFLEWPFDWIRVVNILADRMTDDAVMVCRFLAPPNTHRPVTPERIVAEALCQRRPINYTAVRTALLFNHWNPTRYTIRPEDALRTFDQHRGAFDPLLSGTGDNDLISIEKYRGTDALFFAPPVVEVMPLFERRFHIRAIHFGPYAMSQYFPVIVASKRPPR